MPLNGIRLVPRRDPVDELDLSSRKDVEPRWVNVSRSFETVQPRFPGKPGGARRRTSWILTFAAALVLALAAGVGPALADTVFSDGFESGDFAAWSLVATAGDGTAAVQSAIVKTGSLAAQLSESATAGSKAYVRRTFAAAQTDLTASGDFQVRVQGASGGNVPFFRFFDPASIRIVSLYRQNGTSGSIGLTYAGTHFTTTGTLPIGAWGTIALHVIIGGTASTVEVSLNGTLIYRSTSASLGTAGISTVQIGNDTAAQAFSIVADTINVQNAAAATPTAPVNTAPPTISGTPQVGQTLNASTGSWSGTQPIAYAYAWRRCDTSGGACVSIGATGASYTLAGADVGSTIRVVVTATNSVGPTSATSAATTVVQGAATPPANTSLPTISGTAQSGQTLGASPGAWSGTQPITFAYQWRRCDTSGASCGPIAGATGSSYTLVVADVGSTIRVAVTADNGVPPTATATSAATAVVQAAPVQTSLVALWHMDETSGTVMNDAVGSHTGTLHSVQLGLPGFSGTAYGFSGSGYVSVPTAPDLNPGSANITITIRLKTTSVPATPDWDLIRKGFYTTTGGEFKVEYQPSGQASCGFKGSVSYAEIITGPALNNGVWHTVQCVKTATAIRLVVDGQTFSKTANIGAISNTEQVPIGARPGSEFFRGSLDEASIQIG
jgi:hypothetical protein